TYPTASWGTNRTTQTISDLPEGSYRVTVTDAHGCEATATVAIEARSVPNFTLSVDGDDSKCYYDRETEIVVSNGGTGSTYAWSASATEAGLPAGSDGATVTVTPTAANTYTYNVTITAANACVVTASVPLTIYPVPTVEAPSSSIVEATCYGYDDGSFTLVATGGTIFSDGPTATPYYYQFSIDGGTEENFYSNVNSQVQHTIDGQTAGTYNVVVSDFNGCTASVTGGVEVWQPTAVTATIDSNDIIETCDGQSVGEATVTPGGGRPGTAPAPAYTYAWNTYPTATWGSARTTQTISDLPEGSYSVTVTDGYGCIGSTTVAIGARQVPSINATSTLNDVCLSAPTSTLNVLNNNTLPIASHSWSVTPTDGAGMPADLTTASIEVTPTASATAAVTYTYTDVVTAENGCVVSGDVVLTVNPTAILTHTSGDLDQTLCFEKTLTPIVFEYSGGATGVTLTWTDGTPATTCLNYAVDNTAHTLTISEGSTPVAGTYRYIVQTTGAISPCENPSYSGTIIIHPELTVSITADHQSCVTGNIGVATAHPLGGKPFGTSPDTYYTYLWSNTETTATIDELEGGTYSVTVTDANTCTATASTTIVEKTNPAISISSSNVNCYGETTGSIEVTVTNHGTTTGTSNPYTNGPTAQPNYYVFSIDNGATTVNSSGAHYEQHTFAVSTNGNESSYTYNIYVRDGNDCTASQDVEITQPSLLTATIYSYDTIATCQDQSVGAAQVTPAGGTQATAPAPSYTYAWNTVDAPHWTADSTRQRIENLAAGNYIVTVTDDHSCVATATVAIIPRPVPSINASTTADAVCLSASTSTFSILNNNSLPIASHSWSVDETTGAGLPADLTTESLTVTPSGTSTTVPTTYVYTDVVTAQNGCVVSGDVVLTVNPTAILDHTSGDLDQTLCFEKTLVPIVFEYSGGATGITLTWTYETPATTCLDFAIDNTAHTLTISEGSAPVAGTYAYTVATTGAISPCDNPTLSGTIIIRPELTVSVTGDHQSCVTGNIGVATAHPVGGKPFGTAPDTYYEYAWNNTETTATIDELEGGTYNVTVTDANTCTATASTTIVEQPNPVVAISDVATLCPEIGTTSVEASITTATTADYTYTWTNDGAFAVTTTNPVTTSATSVTATVSVPNIETAGCSNTYTLTLQVEDANNCLSNIAEKVVTVQDVTAPALITSGTWPENITGQNRCFAQADTTGLWDANEIKALFSDCSNITVTVEDVATTTSNCGWTWLRTYTITDACDNIYYVTGTTKPTMSVSGKDLTKPELTGTWPENITNQNNCFANADISGLYSNEQVADLFTDCSPITVTSVDANTLTDDCGWTITRTYTIKDECNNTVDPSPTMSVSGKDQNPPTYTVPPTITVYKTDACTFTADTAVTHSVPTALADDCSDVDDLTLTYTDSGVITATCTDTIKRTWRLVDVCGNVSVVDSVQLILITDTIKPTIARNVDAFPALGVGSCQYEIPDLTGQVTVGDNCTAVADLVITQDPVAGTPTNMNRDVTITVTDKCGNSRSTTILVEYPSDIHVQANPPVICKGQTTTLTVYSGGISTYYDYIWDHGIDATTGTPDNTNTVTVSPEETTTYHVNITNDNNCTQGAELTVTVKPLPVITFTDLGNICPNVGTQEIVANIEATTPGYTYTWTSGLALDGFSMGTQNETRFTIGAIVPNNYSNNPENCDRTNWIKLHVTDNDALHCEYEATYTIVIKDDEAPQLITAGSFPTGEENMNLCYADRPAATPDNDIKALYTDNCSDFTVTHITV
ncbi:MAG: hypothetical protein II815_03195, partial [Bacteroidales bacterium]|nr:hypothetical protein [Bacteroidales bacterium]